MTLRHVLGGNNLGYQGQAPASFLGSGTNAPSQTDDSKRHRRRVSPTYGWSRQGPWGSWMRIESAPIFQKVPPATILSGIKRSTKRSDAVRTCYWLPVTRRKTGGGE